MSFVDIARKHIEQDEGRRRLPYVDTVGKITIGVGWNLTDNGLPDHIIDELFNIGVQNAEHICRQYIPTFGALTDNRKAALMDMAFNLDSKIGGFHLMIAAISRGDWRRAAAEVIDSKFARQVGERARRIADMLERG